MNVYQGHGRRQVGGGIWSTIQRGIRPLLQSLFTTLKPHAIQAGKRVAKSAFSVGTNVAMDALTGQIDRNRIKSVIQKEVDQMKSDAAEKVRGIKRKYVDKSEEQQGSGYKRRRKMPTTKPKNNKRKTNKMKGCKRTGVAYKQKRKTVESKKQPARKGRITKRKSTYKRKTKSKSQKKKTFNDIFTK